MSAESEYVSQPGAAEILNVSQDSIRRYIAAGVLPAYRVHKRTIRIKRADVLALLTPIETNTKEATQRVIEGRLAADDGAQQRYQGIED